MRLLRVDCCVEGNLLDVDCPKTKKNFRSVFESGAWQDTQGWTGKYAFRQSGPPFRHTQGLGVPLYLSWRASLEWDWWVTVLCSQWFGGHLKTFSLSPCTSFPSSNSRMNFSSGTLHWSWNYRFRAWDFSRAVLRQLGKGFQTDLVGFEQLLVWCFFWSSSACLGGCTKDWILLKMESAIETRKTQCACFGGCTLFLVLVLCLISRRTWNADLTTLWSSPSICCGEWLEGWRVFEERRRWGGDVKVALFSFCFFVDFLFKECIIAWFTGTERLQTNLELVMTAVKMILKAKCAANVEGRLPKYDRVSCWRGCGTHSYLAGVASRFSFFFALREEKGRAFVQFRKRLQGWRASTAPDSETGLWSLLVGFWFGLVSGFVGQSFWSAFLLSKLSFFFLWSRSVRKRILKKAAFSWDDCVLRLPALTLLLNESFFGLVWEKGEGSSSVKQTVML